MAARSVLNGRYAEATLGGTLIALLYDWKLTVNGKTAELTAHGDTWEYHVPLPSGWTFTAKSYVVPASAAHLINQLWSANALPAYVTVAGFSGSAGSGTMIFQGTGLPVRGELSAPMELANQEFEIKGHGAPAVGV